ncbi:fatty acyl-CoA synthetase [Archaeoglobus neptunius]|uniref:fatty acyl-CoA synthetase n=1 Tax=Archaeoglobus neptunius TaxID=2798580 RepID=UPI0019288086|nr:fatty acyl-CoA synthetase [Archaeoglobus neptunius]
MLHDISRDVFSEITDENVREIRRRYNKVRRWVIADFLKRSARRYPKKDALVFNHPKEGEIRLKYPELDDEANRLANALLDLDLKKYDRVAILAHNTLHHVLTIFGAAKAGSIYLALNYLMYGKDLAYCINHAEARVLIVEDSLYERIEPVIDDLKTVETFVWSDQGTGNDAPNDEWLSFDDWYGGYGATEPDTVLNIEDPVQMTFTSGTETRPKGVVHTNESLIAQYVGCIIDGEYSTDDICLNTMPIYHCAQRDVFMIPLFYIGGTNVMMSDPKPETILEYVDRYKPTMLFLAPTVWIGLLRHPDFDRYDLSSLRKCYYGASIFPEGPLNELVSKLPRARFYQYYGQTELAPYHTVAKHDEVLAYPKTAGRAGLNLETRLEDENHKEIRDTGKPGEICARGPHVMLMYFKDPEKTKQAFECGWFHSGDIAVMYREGYFEIVDRKKDMIKTGGENVSSREVEEVIYRHPDVWEVAVIGLPHEKWIEAVTAIVVPKPGKNVNPEEIIEFCKRELSPFKVPKAVVVLKPEELPKTPSGKIMKRELRKMLADFYRKS